MNKKIKSIWIYTLFMFLMSLIVVLSWDDFSWGGSAGIERLTNHFDNYNGRYLGNLVIIVITRSVIAKVILYTLTNVGIAWIMHKLLDGKVKMRYIILILMTIPMDIFRQTYGWMSGFANYNVSSLLILAIFYLVFKEKYKPIIILPVFILAFISQFFVENVTMVNVMLSLMVLLLFLFTNRNKIPLTISWIIGSSVGAWLMFQNTAYQSDSSRGVTNIYFSEFFKHLLQDWSEFVIKDNIILIALFSIVIFLILNKPKVIGSYLLFFNIYFISRSYLGINFYNQPLYMLVGELVLIFLFLGILIYVGIKVLEKKDREMYFIYILSAVMMVGPFLIVTPFGPRNILLSYLMLALALGILWSNLQLEMNLVKVDNYTKPIVIIITLFTLFLYSVNCFENQRRLSRIKKADTESQQVVEIRKLPFPFLGQVLDGFHVEYRVKQYKEYYDISQELEIKVSERTLPLPWVQTND